MKSPTSVLVCVAAACLGLASLTATAQQATSTSPKPRTSAAPAHAKPAVPLPATTQETAATNATVRRYCAGCHSDARKSGGLSLAAFDVARAADNAEVSERMIRKLQAGRMPPPGASRPDAAAQRVLVTALETTVDAAA